MKKFNIDRFNLEKVRLGEAPVSLKRVDYRDCIIKDGLLVDQDGHACGTKGDMYTKYIMDKILQEGCLDHNPRPHYEDFYENAKYDQKSHKIDFDDGREVFLGSSERAFQMGNVCKVWVPAHTLSLNSGIECTYDLSKGESPLITLRPIAIKSSVAEILWIYQKESNDLVLFDELLEKNTWDSNHKINNWWNSWAIKDKDGNYVLNEEGHPTIGTCYGESVRRRHMLKEEVIDSIKKDPDGRRKITSLWQIDDFLEPHGLKPCAFLTVWNVRHDYDGCDYLDLTLVQRSSDFATAGCINQVQYVALQKMVAKELGLLPGTFTWKPINIQLYDRHVEQAIEMLNRDPVNCRAEIEVSSSVSNFDDFKPNDISISDYPRELIKKKNPQLKFQLGI